MRACQRSIAVLLGLGDRAGNARPQAPWPESSLRDEGLGRGVARTGTLGLLVLLAACGAPSHDPGTVATPATSAGTGAVPGTSGPADGGVSGSDASGAGGASGAGSISGAVGGSGAGGQGSVSPASGGAPALPPSGQAGTGSTGGSPVFPPEELCSMFAVDEGGGLVITACSDTIRSVDKVNLEQVNGGEWYSIGYGFEAPCNELGTYRGEVSDIRYNPTGSITAYAFFVRSQEGDEFHGSVAIGYEAERIAQVTGVVEGTACELSVCTAEICGVLDPTKTTTTSGWGGSGGASGSGAGGGAGLSAGAAGGGAGNGGAAGNLGTAGQGGRAFGQGGLGTGFPGGGMAAAPGFGGIPGNVP